MVAKLDIDMREVTRLTRTGRLSEAVTLLRGALRGSAQAPAPDQPTQGEPKRIAPLPSRAADDTLARIAAFAPTAGLKGFNPLAGFKGLSGLGRASTAPIAPAGARFEDRRFEGEAGHLGYKLYVPSRSTGQRLPLIVMLHGCTQSPDDFAAGTRMNEWAEEDLFLVAYPAQTPSANASKCWNWFNAADQQRGRGEPALIAGITRQVMAEFDVDPARIYAAGLSAGGAAAAILAATYPDLYAAVGVHSGLACGAARDMTGAFTAMRQGAPSHAARLRQAGHDRVPTIVFHGDGDTTVNAINGTQVIEQAGAGPDLQTSVMHGEGPGGMAYTRTVQADPSGHPVLEQWVLHGAGHAWSGGSPAGSYTEPRGPDASREMVRFFMLQTRGGHQQG